MYRNQGKGDTLVQTVDFNSLRKNNVQPICRVENNFMCFTNQSNSPLLLIGCYSILQGNITFHDSQFSDFPFDNLPKAFQQYCHEKTASEIFNILKVKSKSQDLMAQLLNNYPVLTFILQCWVRKRTIAWLDANPSNECMGNQHQILVDLGSEIRGPLLSMVAMCFKLWVSLTFDLFPIITTASNKEQLGDFASSWQLKIEYKSDSMVVGYMMERDQDLISSFPSSKNSQCGYLRRSKVNDNEIETRSGGQFKSVRKERPGQCQKCGAGKRCECNQIKRKGFGVTPKNNQLSSSTSNPFKSDPFVFGFLNEHNLSKIRESSSGQK